MKKLLVIYFSRTGNCERIAISLKKLWEKEGKFSVSLEKLETKKDYRNLSGFIKASLDSLKREKPDLGKLNFNPEDFDYQLIISPVWANTIAAPVRTYLQKYKNKLKKAVLILTYQLFGAETALKNAQLNKGSNFEKAYFIKLPFSQKKIEKIFEELKDIFKDDEE